MENLMNFVEICKAPSSQWIRMATVGLLLASSGIVNAQDDPGKNKNQSKPSTPPAAKGKPAAPAASHQASSRASSSPRETHENASQAARQNPGMTKQQNSVKPAQPKPDKHNRQSVGQTAPQNVAQQGQPSHGQAKPPKPDKHNRQNVGQTAPQNVAQQGQPSHDQAKPPKPDKHNRQNVGQGSFSSQPNSPVSRSDAPRQPQVPRYPNGQPQTVRVSNGDTVNRDPTGRIREVHTAGGAVITHRADGVRHVEVVRPGNRVIVTSVHGHDGYIQRPLEHNREFVQRTYYAHGVMYAHVYRPITYRGAVWQVYTPVRYYRPGFYAYVYSPWARPIAYDWGWGGDPWYGYYRGYFAPYPAYASPTLWLTDYLVATTLQQAYEDRIEAAAAQSASYVSTGQPGLTPDVKQAIADEVRRQLELESGEGQSMASKSMPSQASYDVPPMFADSAPRVFVVSSSLDVSSAGRECAVTEGDVLQLTAGPSNASTADAVVLASKERDCPKGFVVSVPLQDLQEMQNHMRETIDQGLADLQSRQGQGGMPKLPAAAKGKVRDAPFASEVRPDASVATELTQVAQEADRAEQEVVSQASENRTGAADPVTISLGMTIDEIERGLGRPKEIANNGARTIYVYRDIKITFTEGRVSDVQ
jgi:hypothetical protein